MTECIKKFDLKDFYFINNNVIRLNNKYKSYSDLEKHYLAYNKLASKPIELIFNKNYDIPHCSDLGTYNDPDKPKKSVCNDKVKNNTKNVKNL